KSFIKCVFVEFDEPIHHLSEELAVPLHVAVFEWIEVQTKDVARCLEQALKVLSKSKLGPTLKQRSVFPIVLGRLANELVQLLPWRLAQTLVAIRRDQVTP